MYAFFFTNRANGNENIEIFKPRNFPYDSSEKNSFFPTLIH